ncbi:MAG: right-handed parallel beta-helix repeat-containing protein, partial [Armatimonadetes bacterium]|nr:right-handed parallel beta-helix repeat-containing protein [Armatimonadota bacterium]
SGHGADGPVATLQTAWRLSQRSAGRAVRILMSGGVYRSTAPTILATRPGALSPSAVTIEPLAHAHVVLSGGVTLDRWRRLTDPRVLEALPESARSHVLECNLAACGVTQTGDLGATGFGRPIVPRQAELFYNQRPMALARWPAVGWADVTGAPGGTTGATFQYKGDEPGRWQAGEDIWVHGFWTWNWADSYEQVTKIDGLSHTITTAQPYGVYGYSAGHRFYAVNVLEELKAAGEYVLDPARDRIYFWPPEALRRGSCVLSVQTAPVLQLQKTRNTTLRGLTIAYGRGAGVTITGGRDNRMVACRICNMGTVGVEIARGHRNSLSSCVVCDTGDGAVQLSGGDRRTLNAADNTVTECDLTRFNRWDYTYRPGVLLAGVGNVVSHNHIHDAPHTAILLSGNNHTISYNEIDHVCQQTSDAGAFYMGRDATMRGNVVEFNFFHDIQPRVSPNGQFGDVMSVYLDDCSCGVTVVGNLFVRAGRGVLIGGGRDNVVQNNIFVDCNPAISVDARGQGWASFWFNGKDPTIMNGLAAVPWQRPPWSVEYPQLTRYLADDPAAPLGNQIRTNVCVGGSWLQLQDGITHASVGDAQNVVGSVGMFVDVAHGNYRLTPGAEPLQLGFQQLPVDEMGRTEQAPTPHGARP